MDKQEVIYLVSADRFEDSIVIGFSDGRIGRYSTAFLYGALPQSKELIDLNDEDESEEPTVP